MCCCGDSINSIAIGVNLLDLDSISRVSVAALGSAPSCDSSALARNLRHRHVTSHPIPSDESTATNCFSNHVQINRILSNYTGGNDAVLAGSSPSQNHVDSRYPRIESISWLFNLLLFVKLLAAIEGTLNVLKRFMSYAHSALHFQLSFHFSLMSYLYTTNDTLHPSQFDNSREKKNR